MNDLKCKKYFGLSLKKEDLLYHVHVFSLHELKGEGDTNTFNFKEFLILCEVFV